MCPYPRAPQALAHRDTRFTSEQGDGSTESRPYFIVGVARFKDAHYLTSSYTINHNSMLHYAGALSDGSALWRPPSCWKQTAGEQTAGGHMDLSLLPKLVKVAHSGTSA